MLKLALAAVLAATGSQVPAWIARAVPPPIVAWKEADVLGNKLVEGIAVSGAAGSYSVGVVDSRLDPPEEVLEYDELGNVVKGSHVKTLLAGRITGGAGKQIAVDLFVTPSIGERAWVFQVEAKRLRVIRSFHADRIAISGPDVVLRWTAPTRSPGGMMALQHWHFSHGTYHLLP
jgi:hypothetical protein